MRIRPQRAGPSIGWRISPEVAAAPAEAERAASELDALQRDYRAATLKAVAPGSLTAANAFTRIEAVRQLDLRACGLKGGGTTALSTPAAFA